jgi:hypothetical protein
MAEDLDLDRVIRDPAYRRRVIARLNHAIDDRVAPPEAGNEDPGPPSADRRLPD